MKFTLRFGKHVATGRLSPEQQAVLERLEEGEIDTAEAQRLLGGTVRVFAISIRPVADDEAEAAETAPRSEEAAELSEEERARELIERIAREVDAEKAG